MSTPRERLAKALQRFGEFAVYDKSMRDARDELFEAASVYTERPWAAPSNDSPVTADELAEVEDRVAVLSSRESTGFDVRVAEGTLFALGRTLLPRLAADVRAIENMIAEAGVERHKPTETTRDLVARLIADANRKEDERGEEEDDPC